MPFDLFVAHAGDLDEARRPRRLITPADFERLMQGGPIARRVDGACWIEHPGGGPWGVVARDDAGFVRLSTSYGDHRYCRNFPDLFDLALRLAGPLGARVFEEVGGREVTAANVDALLAIDGDYVQQQVAFFRDGLARMNQRGNAPLEYPLGPIDLVSDYLLFTITPARAVASELMHAALEKHVPEVTLDRVEDGYWVLRERAAGKPVTRVMHSSDGNWQVLPYWGYLPFATVAPITARTADVVRAAAAGAMRLRDRPYSAALRAEVQAMLGGLGVELYLWLGAQPPPAS